MRLNTKLAIPQLAILLLFIAAGIALWLHLRTEERSITRTLGDLQRAQSLSQSVTRHEGSIQRNLLSYRIDRRQRRLDAIIHADIETAKTIDALALAVSDRREHELVSSLIQTRNQIIEARYELMRAIQGGHEARIRATFERWTLFRTRIDASLDDLDGYNLQAYQAGVQRIARDRVEFIRLVAYGALFAIVVTIASFVYIRYDVGRRLEVLTAGIRDIGAGKLASHVDRNLERASDEIGELARTFNKMTDQLSTSYSALARARDELELRVEERTTELKRTTEELRRSNSELAQFAYVASHDLQEPLRMVSSYVDLLGKRYKGQLDERADKYIHYAVDGAKRMSALIRDILEFSRIGTRAKELGPTDTGGVLDQALQSLGDSIKESNGAVERGKLPTVLADARQLEQVFQNLVGNALKFRGTERPRVRVSSEKADGEWVFTVADNGIGIAPEFRERVFGLFQRLHGAHKYPGTGIGLAICKKVVERHGGRIWVDSEPGRGASFHFTIPA